MADVDPGDKAPPLVPGAHRVIRALDASDGPFIGLLVTRGDAVAVQVDAERLAGWGGWRFAGAEHVAGPVDLVRRAEGHDVLLPWCTERVGSLLARRHVADEPLSLGECSTLVASMLRGLDELAEGAATESGDWWITGDGRPVFAFGDGDDARAQGERVVYQLAEGCRDKAMGRLLAAVQVGLQSAAGQPRIPRRQIEIWESELFEIASPRPLRCDVHTPERAREVARTLLGGASEALSGESASARRRTRVASRAAAAHEGRIRRHRASRRPGPFAMLESLRAAAADMIERWRESVRRRPGDSASRRSDTAASSAKRRRSLVVAGAAAAIVLGVGMLWPSDDSGEAAESSDSKAVNASTETPASSKPLDDDPLDTVPSAVDEGEAPDRTDAEAEVEPAVAAADLLSEAIVCLETDDQVCAHVLSTESGGELSRLADIAAAAPPAQLIDEYGDVAVIRLGHGSESVEAPGDAVDPGSAHILVLVRVQEKWLVRDVYDVADQP